MIVGDDFGFVCEGECPWCAPWCGATGDWGMARLWERKQQVLDAVQAVLGVSNRVSSERWDAPVNTGK